jgi:hypothetical protein
MALHLAATGWHLAQAANHASLENEKEATAELIKAGASLIPGGSIVAGVLMGAVIDDVVHNGGVHTADAVTRGVSNNLGNILDSAKDAIDAFGDGDGVVEVSDILSGLADSIGDLIN